MDGSRTCQELQWEIGALFTCSEHGDHQRIRTPYLYPDGDNIDLFCKVVDDVVTVSDLADTTGWLRMQAALRVSDLWFTFRTQAVQSITDKVTDFLTEREFGFDRAERLAGRSGRGWTVYFHVRTERRSSLVLVLSTGNRAAAHRVAEHVLAAWHDLNHLAAGPEALTFISLFDDTADVCADEDFRLVEPLSMVSRWSRPDEFSAVLREAA